MSPCRVDLSGKFIGQWKVIRLATKCEKPSNAVGSFWMCECQCESKTKRIVSGKSLLNGVSKSCGCVSNSLKDLSEQEFGQWKVLRKATVEDIEQSGVLANDTKAYWVCECSCGNIRIVRGTDLRNGKSTSCGHASSGYKDLKGEKFGLWEVLRRASDAEVAEFGPLVVESTPYWVCKCGCEKGTIRIVVGRNLKNGSSTSCGCYRKYSRPLNINRTAEQRTSASSYETEIIEELSLVEGKYIRNDRKMLDGKEIDIYIPDRKLGIEFNGNFWHSEEHKDKNYHQRKSLQAREKGIRLVHIFEHEYSDERKRKIIVDLLKSNIYGCRNLYARNCEIKAVESSVEALFNERYHLQGNVNSSIAYGLYYKGELQSLMSFGRPRFDSNATYELLRYTTRQDVRVVGGAERILKYFRERHSGSIVSYCDISKFTGEVYERLGFKFMGYSEPSYIWYDEINNIAYSRYQCQKHKLIAKGWGTASETEKQIMERLGHIRIYDCGNVKYILE